jgi:quinol monooxygenase YgiN
MLIILGAFILDQATSDRREEWLDGQRKNLILSRADPGCIEFTLGADPVDRSRVLLVEIWESLETLQAHMNEMPERGDPRIGDGVVSFDSMRFEVAEVLDLDLPQRFAPRSDKRGWWNGDLTPS